MDAEYLLVLRWSDDAGLDELTDYLRRLSGWIPVTVVDGSDAELFARHAERWNGFLRHLAPADRVVLNGKARGVMTGVRAASAEVIVVADDDIRYSQESLEAAVAACAEADLVRPQNYFSPLPWHARWDTARTLINRAFHSDFPGTLIVRREVLARSGGYDGDVLFENLELIRTVEAVGGEVVRADALFVRRLPPTAARFGSQRVRQAYDSFAQPARLAVELALLPLIVWGALRPRRLAPLALATVAVAELGRRRSRGREVFPASAAVWAPAWVAERAVASWLAVGAALRGGARYHGHRIPVAAHSRRAIRSRLQEATR